MIGFRAQFWFFFFWKIYSKI